MKKFLATILAVIYLSTSMGATLHLHYCMDKLVAWSFGKEETNKKSCPYCGMAKATNTDKHCGKEIKGCCKDEQKQLKIEKDQKVSETGFDFNKPIFQSTIHSALEINTVYVLSPFLEYPLTHAPPRTQNVSLFVLNCVFRI
jgi:hypothetical protein